MDAQQIIGVHVNGANAIEESHVHLARGTAPGSEMMPLLRFDPMLMTKERDTWVLVTGCVTHDRACHW